MKTGKIVGIVFFLLLTLTLIVGCQNSSGSSEFVQSQTEGLTLHNTLIVESTQETFQSIIDITSTPTVTTKQFPSSTEGRNLVLTDRPNFTPFPTVATEDNEGYIGDLHSINKICNPPCWLNIIPGETAFKDIQGYLRSISKEYDDYFPEKSYLLTGNWGEEIHFDIHGNPDIVTSIQIGGAYPVDEFLVQNEIPEEIWISVDNAIGEEGNWPFRLVFFYPSRGMIAYYDGWLGGEGFWLDRSRIQFCLDQIDQDEEKRPMVWIESWFPDSSLSFDNYYKTTHHYPKDFPINFYRIEESSSISVDEFYFLYSDPTNMNQCLPLDFDVFFPSIMTTPTGTE